jgi:hypothetical protein
VLVTRVARDAAGHIGTEDGYLYSWASAGELVDVRSHHLELLLALPGYTAHEVEVVDPPLVLPVYVSFDLGPATTVAPTVVDDGPLDLTGVPVDDPVLPEPEPAPHTAVPPDVIVERLAAPVRVTHRWSPSDVERARAQGAAVGGADR